MKKKYKITFISIGVLILILVIMYQSGVFITGKVNPGNKTVSGSPVDPSKIMTIKESEVPQFYNAVGTIHSRTEVELAARITARILEVKARSGDKVKKDEILIELDKSDLNAQLSRAREMLRETQSGIKAAGQEVIKAKAAFTLAKSNFDRNKLLFAKDVIPKKTLEESTSRYEQAESALSQSEENKMRSVAAADAAQAAVNEASAKLTFATIKSPFDGIVAKQLADPGDLASPGIILMTVFDPSRIMFYVPISESLVSMLKIGSKIPMHVPALKKTFDGEIREIVPSIDPGSRTFLVKICVNKTSQLMPGMFGSLKLQTGTQKAILIPESAIIRIGQLEYVQLVQKNNFAVKQLIRTVKYDKDQAQVISGLKPGDKILQ